MRAYHLALGGSVSLLLLFSLASAAHARKKTSELRYEKHAPPASDRFIESPRPRFTTAAASTTFLGAWDFDGTVYCDAQGWTSHDVSVPLQTFFHVSDATELDGGSYGRLLPLRGAKSLWCGLPPDSLAFPQCGWVEAPGYGNGWKQIWRTKNCIDVEAFGQISYVFSVDSEYNYDATYVEVSQCGWDWWVLVDGGKHVFDGAIVDSTRTSQIPLEFDSNSVEIRFRFSSDGAWSDEDGLWVGDGALLLDNIVVMDVTGTILALEDFEGDAIGAHETADWTADVDAPFGDYAGLFWGNGLLQEDGCATNLSCLWGFFEGSPYNYQCGGHPEQTTVPYGDANIGYINNEVWSPWIAWNGTGNVAKLEFDVYRDLALDDYMVYKWRVRSMVDGCVTLWRDRGWFYGRDKDWYRHRDDFGDLVEPGASYVQVAIGAFDICPLYGYPWWGCSACHSHAPLIDNVVAYREPFSGPLWRLRAYDLFQDTFPRDGSLTGTGRADMANDPAHGYQEPEYTPGDSAVVYSVTDNVNGLVPTGVPPYYHRSVYAFFSVAPPDTLKAGVHLENTNLLGGLPRFPFVGMVSAGGREWTQLNCDRRRNRATTVISNTQFCVDLPDDLFEAGDTIFYFFGAHNTLGEWSYWTRETGTTYAMADAASAPLEFQILPGAGYLRGGDILYVDGMDGLGAQPYFDASFRQLGLYDLVDRFDINSPSSGVSNRPGTRVYDPDQVITPYRVIIWNTGDLSVTIGNGSGQPEKSDDWPVLDAFLDGLLANEATGGLYLNGDDLPSVWSDQYWGSAISMRDWLHYSTPPGGENHAPLVGVSPYGVGVPGGPFDHGGVDTLIAFGGCPLLNDFDYVTAEGSAEVLMTYEGSAASAAAVIGEKTTSGLGEVGVVMSGFSFHYIRDDRPSAVMDRTHHLNDILVWLTGSGTGATPVAGGPACRNSLAQNYPNPFNPATTIAFTVKERGHVRLTIYNVAGARVRRLVDDTRAPGVTHTVVWDGRNGAGQAVASGVYFYRLEAKDFTRTRKMVVLK